MKAFGPALCALSIFLFEAGFVSGGELRGLVTEIIGTTVTISSRSDERPKPGDQVEIFVTLPDLDGVAIIATGRVKSSDGQAIVAEIEKATGKVKLDQFARIRTGDAATTGTPAPGRPGISPGTPIPANDLPPLNPATTQSPRKESALVPLPVDGSVIPSLKEPMPMPAGAPPGDFAEIVDRYRHAVFLAHDPTKGSGTAFAISRKHRLLATNAHVADITDRVIMNQSRTVYRVINKWYHPGVVRRMDDGKTRVYSANPSDGEVDAHCPDLALLQLEESGADLPAEIPLAGLAEFQQIQASELGVLGFPGYQRDQNIAKRDLFASATFIKGTVSRMTGYDHEAEAPFDQQRMVHFSAPLYPGFSGSPVFLRNGKVAVVANHLHREAEQLGYGLRCDALWELIDFAEVRDKIPGAPEQIARTSNYSPQPEPRVQTLRQAMRLVAEATDFRHHHEFDEAFEHLDEAVKILPDYWKPYWMRGIVIDHTIKYGNPAPTTNARLHLHRDALAAHLKADQLYRSGHGKPNGRIVLDVARELVNIARLTNQPANLPNAIELQRAVDLLNDASVLKNVGDDGGYFFALRGSVKADQNNLAGALKDLDSAIRLDPTCADFYSARAQIWQKLGQNAEAASDRRQAQELHAKEHEEHVHVPGSKPGHHDHKR